MELNLDPERQRKLEQAHSPRRPRITPGSPADLHLRNQAQDDVEEVPPEGTDYMAEFADEGPRVLRVDGIAQEVSPPPKEGLRISIPQKTPKIEESPRVVAEDELRDEPMPLEQVKLQREPIPLPPERPQRSGLIKRFFERRAARREAREAAELELRNLREGVYSHVANLNEPILEREAAEKLAQWDTPENIRPEVVELEKKKSAKEELKDKVSSGEWSAEQIREHILRNYNK